MSEHEFFGMADMSRLPITVAEANRVLFAVLDLPVSLAWQGYGSAIFLELGNLGPAVGANLGHQNGDATIHIGWDWRVEQENKVLFGSSNSRPEIEDGLGGLLGASIKRIALEGRVPELSIELSNGQRLVSAAMCSDTSAWDVRLPGPIWIDCDKGIVYTGEGDAISLTPKEEAAFEHAHRTAQRWGIPTAEGLKGHCQSCASMMRIDGHADFLDYGVCTSAVSPFDGRIVNLRSGCAVFVCSGIGLT